MFSITALFSMIVLSIVAIAAIVFSIFVTLGGLTLFGISGTIGEVLTAGANTIITVLFGILTAGSGAGLVVTIIAFIVFAAIAILLAFAIVPEFICELGIALIFVINIAVLIAGTPFTCGLSGICALICIFGFCIAIGVYGLYPVAYTILTIVVATFILVNIILVNTIGITIEVCLATMCTILTLTCTGGAGVACAFSGLIVFTLETFVVCVYIAVTCIFLWWCPAAWVSWLVVPLIYVACLGWTFTCFPTAALPFFVIACSVAVVFGFGCVPAIFLSLFCVGMAFAALVLLIIFICVTGPVGICSLLILFGLFVVVGFGITIGVGAFIILWVFVAIFMASVTIIIIMPALITFIGVLCIIGMLLLFLIIVISQILGIPLEEFISSISSIVLGALNLIQPCLLAPCSGVVSTTDTQQVQSQAQPTQVVQPQAQSPSQVPQNEISSFLSSLSNLQIMAGGLGLLSIVLIFLALLR